MGILYIYMGYLIPFTMSVLDINHCNYAIIIRTIYDKVVAQRRREIFGCLCFEGQGEAEWGDGLHHGYRLWPTRL